MADLANDKYRATLRSTFIMDPLDSSIAVNAIPTNLPTLVTLGWNTIYETVFRVTGTSGSNSSNYALTGITKIKGADVNIPEGAAVNCLNHEEYFNQYSEEINQVIEDVEEVLDAVDPLPTGDLVGTTDTQTLTNKRVTKRVVTTASGATITPTGDTADIYKVTALAEAATIAAPSGTPTDGQTLILYLLDNGTNRALTWNAIYRVIGTDLPTTTTANKLIIVGLIYNSAASKWDVVSVNEQD